MYKRIKLELYYVKRMLKQRRGFLEWYRYIKNKFFPLALLRRMAPVSSAGSDDCEIHVLTQKSGLWMTYWAVRSFIHHSGLSPRIVVHDDGTIDERTARMFESKFSNIHVLRRAEADQRFYDDPNIPDIVKRHRRECRNIYLLTFVDHFFLSAARNVIIVDNDILFYNRPIEIIEFVKGNRDVDAIYSAYGDGRNPLDVDEEYKQKYAAIADDASRLNSGLMIFDKSKIAIQWIAEYFAHTTNPHGHLIEQTGWGFVLSQVPHAFFPEDRYRLWGKPGPQAVCKHFTTPRRHEMYAYGIDDARERMGI